MADIKFKLEEGLLGDVTKAVGKEFAKIALSPLTGGYEGSSSMIDGISSTLQKRGYYKAEQEVKKNTENIIKGYVGLLSKVKVIGKVGFFTENFNDEELGLLEDTITKYLKDKTEIYRNTVKRALSFDSQPPKTNYNSKNVTREFSELLNKEITKNHKRNPDEYYRINKWAKEGMKVVGSTLPRLVVTALDSLARQWGELEVQAERMNRK